MRRLAGVSTLLFLSALFAAGQGSALIEAARADDPGSVRALIEGGADLNAREPDGATALAWAAMRSNAETAVALLVRIGTAEIYRQVEKLPEILESIAVGQEWNGDVRVVLFVKLREGVALDEPLRKIIRETIRANTTARHVPAKIVAVADIPRTLSGKIVELAVRETIHDRPVSNTDALANPEALEHFRHLPELTS
jgi:ankyrin repeat protein